MRKIVSLLVLFGAGISYSSPVYAAITPLSVSIFPPVQFPPGSFTVTGVRTSVLWGSHQGVYGIDLGAIGNTTNGGFGGIAVSGIFNINRGTATVIGLQATGVTNINMDKARIYGLQFAAIMNANRAESTHVGFQLALANISPHTLMVGAQLGLYNRARTVTGFQIGVINVTENLHGLQIGLLNFNRTGLFSVAPILNFGF